MSKAFLKFSSVTYAIRAQKLLERQGIRSYMKKLTGTPGAQGCGYGLEINDDPEKARRLLAEADIRLTGIAYT